MKLMKIIELEDYLKTADAYDNPKTLKIVESGSGGGVFWTKAITFPMTFQIQWHRSYNGVDALTQSARDLETIVRHNHMKGKVEDITTGPRM